MSRRAEWRWGLPMLVICGIYLGASLDRGWYPHDEGALGQTAERVLHGEVPHRDFDEPYTGLLTYVHALAFKLGGIKLTVLRLPLFAATLLWLACLFRIALRFVPPAAASAVTLVALAWSVPNYPASMPSWYNLFFATAGIAALLRWQESRSARWLVLAGLAGGVSFLIKLSGLFYVAGVLLFLLFATSSAPGGSAEEPVGDSPRLFPAVVTIALMVFAVLLWRSVAPFYQPRVIYHFIIPGIALSAALAVREWRRPGEPSRARFRRLLQAGVPFLAGLLLPIAVFFIIFGLLDGIPALLEGVFVAPFRRLAFANMRPPAPFWLLASVPLFLLLRPRQDWNAVHWRRTGAGLAVVLAGVLWLAAVDSFPHRLIWQSLRGLAPALALLGAAAIAWPAFTRGWASGGREKFVLLASVTGLASLIQFPYSSPVYFLYVAPLILLTVVGLVQSVGRTPRPLAVATLVFYGGFAMLLVVPGASRGLGFRYAPQHDTVPLQLPRAGLRVNPEDAQLYEALIPRLQMLARGQPIWAGPDAPEVYFLSGLRNRTRALFDFLGGDEGSAPAFLGGLDRIGVGAVVLNTAPSFSPALPPSIAGALRQRFPEAEVIGRFELRWRR